MKTNEQALLQETLKNVSVLMDWTAQDLSEAIEAGDKVAEAVRLSVKNNDLRDAYEKLRKHLAKNRQTYWQPKFDENANVVGHEFDTVYSFQVWRSKTNMVEKFPNCIPVPYSGDDIEGRTYMD